MLFSLAFGHVAASLPNQQSLSVNEKVIEFLGQSEIGSQLIEMAEEDPVTGDPILPYDTLPFSKSALERFVMTDFNGNFQPLENPLDMGEAIRISSFFDHKGTSSLASKLSSGLKNQNPEAIFDMFAVPVGNGLFRIKDEFIRKSGLASPEMQRKLSQKTFTREELLQKAAARTQERRQEAAQAFELEKRKAKAAEEADKIAEESARFAVEPIPEGGRQHPEPQQLN